jgi:accessory gene regulator B
MINRISEKIAFFLLNKKVIEQEELEIYIYGYEVLISSFIDFSLVLLFAAIFNKVVLMTVFFVMFVSIRIYTGGYHADTFWKCKIVFIMICLLLTFTSYIKVLLMPMIIIMMFYNATVFIFAPVENINKPLTNCEKTKYRRISICLSIIWTTIAVITYFSFNEICQSITVTALIIAVMMIVGKNINRKEESKNEIQ